MVAVTMTIAGSDSGGGAGIQADIKTFQELGTFGTSVITALTAQNTLGVEGVQPTPPSFVLMQLDALLSDFKIDAIKTGMLFSSDIIEVIAHRLKEENIPLIVDPVMIAKGGASLMQQEAVAKMVSDLFPLATVITPNIPEAEQLTNSTITTVEHIHIAAQKLLAMGPKVVVIKGGHIEGDTEACDRIFFDDGKVLELSSKRIDTKDTHGTGCTFSAAITAGIAKGQSIDEAIHIAKDYIQAAISNGLHLGHGHGPTNHFAYRHYIEEEK